MSVFERVNKSSNNFPGPAIIFNPEKIFILIFSSEHSTKIVSCFFVVDSFKYSSKISLTSKGEK